MTKFAPRYFRSVHFCTSAEQRPVTNVHFDTLYKGVVLHGACIRVGRQQSLLFDTLMIVTCIWTLYTVYTCGIFRSFPLRSTNFNYNRCVQQLTSSLWNLINFTQYQLTLGCARAIIWYVPHLGRSGTNLLMITGFRLDSSLFKSSLTTGLGERGAPSQHRHPKTIDVRYQRARSNFTNLALFPPFIWIFLYRLVYITSISSLVVWCRRISEKKNPAKMLTVDE